MPANLITQFHKQQYINIETYRKSGEAVRTPVWFAQEENVLYVRTGAVSGKVKRMRRNPDVKVAPCDMRGGLRGDWVPAHAELLNGEAAEHVNQLLDKKYGLVKKIFELFTPASDAGSASVALKLAAEE